MPDSSPSPLLPSPTDAMARFRDALDAGYAAHPGFDRATLAERRRIAERVRAPFNTGGPPMRHSRDTVLPIGDQRLRLRVHRPAEEPGAVLLYLHGGGWTMFSLDTHDRLMREYAARTGFAVVGLDYALAPEHRFPVPVRQTVAALGALRDGDAATARALGFDPGSLPLAVAGDSAGGHTALAAAIALRDAGRGELLSAVLMSYAVVSPPPAEPEPDSSYALFDGPGFTLTAAEMRGFWNGYCSDPAERADPRADLLAGPLSGLPPVLLHVAECDVLRDENLRLAAALHAAGTAARAVCWPGTVHSFLEATAFGPESGRALDDAARWLRATLRFG